MRPREDIVAAGEWRGVLVDKLNSDPIWEQALSLISQQVNDGILKIWFEPMVGLGLSSGTYSVAVASDFARDWIEARHHDLMTEAVSQVVGEPTRLEIVVSPLLSRPAPPDASLPPGRPGGSRADSPAEPATAKVGDRSRRDRRASPPTYGRQTAPPYLSSEPLLPATPDDATASGAGLLDKYTFETFVIGPSNRFAHAAALAAAETPGRQYNPLFIYGGVGLGKTHLLQAIGNYAVRNHPALKVRYLTLETFTNDFINSLRDNSSEDFKTRYRSVDLLLIDDIQFLQKKEQTQEEFFHTFNTLYDAQKQIVITSDRHPKGLATLEDRLVSRFEWGLITDIQPPDLETRVAILRRKVRADGVVLADDEALMVIASRVPTNIRELEGCLTRVVAFSSFSKRPITVELTREVLKDIPETPTTKVTIDLILTVVAEITGISVSEIIGDKRSRPIVDARHYAMYLARELTDASLPKIGERIGNRDHTTVLHAVDKITKLMRVDQDVYNLLQHLTTKIKSAP
ncbi:MAG: chromosomal replication initiator protein DnaA [Thermoleophilia bacterium]|nr:chromosomal replication initiator protein DnaA [Thermoleophilia bacterium]